MTLNKKLLWFALLVVLSVVMNGVKSSEDQDGSFAFSYEADDGSYHQEIRNADGSFRVEYGKTADELDRRKVLKFPTKNLRENDEGTTSTGETTSLHGTSYRNEVNEDRQESETIANEGGDRTLNLGGSPIVGGLNNVVNTITDTITRYKKGEKGQKGEKGEKGNKGIKGEKGVKGQKGEQGQKGQKGVKGQKGQMGQKGEKGEKGMQGLKGAKGMKGEKGQEGVKGEKGIKGQKGEQGQKGQKGVKGQKGQMGQKGEKGEKGMKGLKGTKGMKGEKGQKGQKGIKGADEKPFPLYIGTAADKTTCSTIFPLYNRYFCTVLKGENWDDSRSFCQEHGLDLFVPYTDTEFNGKEEFKMVADALRLDAQNTLHSYWIGGKYDDGNSQWEYINSEDRTHIDALVCAGSGTSGYALVINKNGNGCFGRIASSATTETVGANTFGIRAFCESKIV